MNNYQLTVNKVKKTGLPLTIVTLCCCILTVVSGCNDIFDHPNTGKTTETGTILLSISDNAPNGQSTERTIMPTTKLNDFAEFKLDFTAQTPGNTNLSATWTSSSGTVDLPVGTWELTITAYLAGEGSLLEAAKSEIKTIELTSGAAVPLSVQLFPIEEGEGTFSWDVSFNGSFESAIMEIWHTGDNVKFKTVTFGVTNNTNQNSQTSLAAGEYRVIFTLSNGEEEVAINEILHVYKNMVSGFTKTFTDNHFPVTLLNFVLSALEEKNLTEAGITAGHFPYLGINGVDGNNFEGLVGWFYELCTSVTTPHDLDALKVLVDAALVGIAGDDTDFVNAAHYGYRGDAEAAIAGLIRNGTDITFEWTGDDAVIVHTGAYEVGIVFDGGISLYPTLMGTVTITVAQVEVTVAMWDSYGDGWNGAALRINVNGTNLSPNVSITNSVGKNPGYHTFNVNSGDVVMFYWVSGQYDSECAFAVYYSDDPPSPAFNPNSASWLPVTDPQGRVLLYKQFSNSGSVANGTLMGSFTASVTTIHMGQTLTVNTGNLGGSGDIFYQWNRDGIAINGANNATYTVQTADIGSTITVTVTRDGCLGEVTSAPTTILPPLTGTVSISGTAGVGWTLTANTGSLGGTGTVTYQWMRDETTVIGTNSSAYTVQSADVGSTITVTVARSGYSGSVSSNPTAPVSVITYTITYLDAGGGAFSGTHGAGYPTTHTYGTATALVNPAKTGYTFDGWFAASAGTGTALTSLSATGYTANITLYAKWFELPDIEMVRINAGTFQMGSPAEEPGHITDETLHSVTLTQGFYMGKYQVTQEQYEAVMGSNPSGFKTSSNGDNPANRPVERVCWYDALVFCNRLSMAEGLSPAYSISGSTDPADWGTVPTGSNATWNAVEIVSGSIGYRLPTEAQWEYACRAGTTTAYNWGTDTISSSQANYNSSIGRTTEVGSYDPNDWGLYDMHGNVWEWCWDWYSTNYGSTAGTAQEDPTGAVSGTDRVRRGGSWDYGGRIARSAYRSSISPINRGSGLGFRLVRP